ncbi:glycosyltransferase family 2 protein [Microlunatus panaciterrae]|uniref:GT2 family glycosyltransferase n=1 Tax=Microlunatus panaciterrae TaxID=400768 RepID=A0ABS2RHR2_9ACTN|nr:glycosyltransferase family 2 protein [Microlunatus panaciterrae]MBM7798497.1 GT2 family glycosyltransferase [Microlunatus panaciterrae]
MTPEQAAHQAWRVEAGSPPDSTDLTHERVTVVVVMYNSGPLLADFVTSLEEGLAGVEFELVAVDNASPDDSAEIMETIAPSATIVRAQRNGGYAAGINLGVAAAGPHTAILVVNSDVRLGRNCVAQLLTRLRRPGVGIAVPRLVDGEGQVIDSMRREPSVFRAFCDAIIGAERAGRRALGEVITDRRQYEQEQTTDWAEGSTQLISAECWRVCGPWDESFFLYSEETEYDLRARDLGFSTIFVPSAGAIHLEGGSGISDTLWSLQVVNRVRFYRRRHGRLATVMFWLATFVRESTRAALGRQNSRAAARALMTPRYLRATAGPGSVRSKEGQEE